MIKHVKKPNIKTKRTKWNEATHINHTNLDLHSVRQFATTTVAVWEQSPHQDNSRRRHPVWLEAAMVQPMSSLLIWPPLWHACCRDAAITIEIGQVLGCYACYTLRQALGGEGQPSPSPATMRSSKCQQTPTGMVIPASSHWSILSLFSIRWEITAGRMTTLQGHPILPNDSTWTS